MKEQMSMFEDGGLLDEGGSIDPVSGNDVPPGSTQEEVRDDIPAQLSEGEFVFPADVVRFIGLGNLMRIRQDAKMGLKQMEAMGQMGNSDEATMPDDLPFDVNDLDMEDDGVVEFADGGVVQAQQGAFMQPANTGIMGYQKSQFANYKQPTTNINQPYVPPSYTPPVQQIVPTMPQQPVPTFEGFTGVAQPDPGGYDEMRTYVNDAGMTIQIPFKNGQPITPIPEGYRFLDPEETQTDKPTVTSTTGATSTRTPQVEEGAGYQEPDNKAFGGFANSKDSDAYNEMTKDLGIYQAGSLSLLAGLGYTVAGKATPKDVSTAMYQAKVAAIEDLGIAKVNGNTIDYTDDDGSIKEASKEDLDFVAAVMRRAKAAVEKGIEAKEAAKQALEQAKADKAAKDRALDKDVAGKAREKQYMQDDNSGGETSSPGGGYSGYSSGAAQESTGGKGSQSAGSGWGGMAKGGSVTKQMKRSGLASK